MVSSRSQASDWYFHVQGIEVGPSRMPFQYPHQSFSVEFSCAPNLYSKFVIAIQSVITLHSPYSDRLPCWSR